MTNILTRRATKIILLVVGLLAAVSFMRDTSHAYNYYYTTLPNWPWATNWIWFGAPISMALFGGSVVALCVAVAKSEPGRRHWWRPADYLVSVVTVATTEITCLGLAVGYPGPELLLVYSAVAYLAAVGLLLETVARLRDRCLASTLYWARFFRLHPPREPLGALMLIAVVGNLIALAATIPQLRLGTLITTAFFLFILAALTYFCGFELSASARREQANAEKIAAERFKAELITNVSHDIRTPLTSIINYVDLLKGLDVDRDDFREYVSVLEAKSGRLKALLDDLMDASKLTSGAVTMDARELDLAEIVGQLAGEFDDRFAEQNLTLVQRQPDGPVLVSADSRHLWRVLENLFCNAAKYSLPGTRVFAQIARVGASVVFSLRNTSLAPIDLEPDALTEQFIRGDRSRHTDGNGLGLFIAKSLTEAMGGAFAISVTGDLFEAHVEFAEIRQPVSTMAADLR